VPLPAGRAQHDPAHHDPAHHDPRGHFDRNWLRSVGFTLGLVALVALALGETRTFIAAAMLSAGLGFGFFYLLFPAGLHFGLTMANGLAIYFCLFALFRESNFPDAGEWPVLVGLVLPVVAFLSGCVVNRGAIGHALARRPGEVTRLPPVVRWVPGLVVVGIIAFSLPALDLDADAQGQALLASMAVIGVLVGTAARDVVLLLIDVAALFQSVAGRVRQLVMPVVAFMTYYLLLIVVFACLYRIVEMVMPDAQFRIHGELRGLSVAEALYFSVITLATVGYGDIVPVGAMVRALAAAEVVCGVLLLLFGFAEITRAREAMRAREERQRRDGETD
jgi:voltage-gated potassium channel